MTMLKKILMILLNIIIIFWFLFMTFVMIEMIVSEIKYFSELHDGYAIVGIIVGIVYIISMLFTYFNCCLNNKWIKTISLSTIIIGFLLECCNVEDLNGSLSWIMFLYLPIIAVFAFGTIRNRRKSEL